MGKVFYYICIKFVLLNVICNPYNLLSQSNGKTNQETIHETLTKLKKAKTENEKLDAYVDLAWMYRITNANLALAYSDSTIALSKKLNKTNYYWSGLNSKATALSHLGNIKECFPVYQLALQIAEKNNFKLKTAHTLYNIGTIFGEQRDYKNAEEYILKALKIFTAEKDTASLAIAYNGLASNYGMQDDFEKALTYYNKVVSLSLLTNDFNELGLAYNNIGNCYYYMGFPKKSKDYYYKSIECHEKTGVPGDLVSAYSNYAYMLNEEKQFDEAYRFYQKALKLAKVAADRVHLIRIYSYIAEMYLAKNDFKNAYYYADTSKILKDSSVSEQNIRAIHEMSKRFDSEKKQIEIENLGKENVLKEKENKQQKLFLIIIGFALIIAILLAIYAYKQYKAKHIANEIISKQKESIEEKQKEILDSITYAKRLQEAILPSTQTINNLLPENFILYKPKDIVAGDFYWLEQKNNLVFIAAADCTGHGVPGAMVSVVCSNALHRAVNEFNITTPGNILDKARELVLETFSKSDKDVKDGMDISLCCIDTVTKLVTWSGANNPLWYVQNHQLYEITATKQAIGKTDNPTPFASHSIQLSTGDVLFLFTDGFADQFGGPKGKKFKYKPFKEILLSNYHLNMENQKDILIQSFENWKNNLEQVDDVCVIGIKL